MYRVKAVSADVRKAAIEKVGKKSEAKAKSEILRGRIREKVGCYMYM